MNTERKARGTFCWSCGNPPENCICGKEIVPMVVNKPTSVPDVCGVKNLNDFNVNNEPWLDPNRRQELIPRPCCNCQKFWVCNQNEWVNGICPNCKAEGPDDIKHTYTKTEFNKISENLDKKSAFKSINNSELFKYMESEESLKNLELYLESEKKSAKEAKTTS